MGGWLYGKSLGRLRHRSGRGECACDAHGAEKLLYGGFVGMLDFRNSGMSSVTKTKVDADRGTVVPTKNCLRDVDAILDNQTLGSSLLQHAFSIIRRSSRSLSTSLPLPENRSQYILNDQHSRGTTGRNCRSEHSGGSWVNQKPSPAPHSTPKRVSQSPYHPPPPVLSPNPKPSPRDFVRSVPPLIHLRTLAGTFKRTW